MKKVLCAVVFAVVGLVAFAQQKPVVAVAPFENIAGVSNPDANMIMDIFYTRLGNMRQQLTLVNRSVVEQIIKEHNFQVGDWSNKQKTAALGEALNANWIVQGKLRNSGSNILIIVQFYDIKTFEFQGGTDLRLVNASEAYDRMDEIVDKLIQAITGGGSGNRQAPVSANLVRVEGGTFTMGSPASEGMRDDGEIQHQVTVSSFYIGKYEVTQKEYTQMMGLRPRWFGGRDNDPARCSWHDAIDYCNKLSLKEGLTPCYQGSGDDIICDWSANGYRLPTEAEWEYAAKGGGKDLLIFTYAGSNNADAVAWYRGNTDKYIQPVGTKAPNSLGLYDMSGNVSEWCWDWASSYASIAQKNPRGPDSPILDDYNFRDYYRIYRGGSVGDSPRGVRSSRRGYTWPSGGDYVGIRVVRSH